jgi:hypothetical protein
MEIGSICHSETMRQTMRQPDFPPWGRALGYSRAAVGRARFAAAVVGFLCGGLICADARADEALPDVLRAPATLPAGASGGWAQRFAGSALELSSYVGSGTFYASGYRDPYVSIAAFARPTYDLGTRYKLSLNVRLYAETELTEPDNPEGRHFYPYDPWVWLSALNLHTFERAKLRVGGILRTILPLSYESRYANLLFGLGAGFNLNRPFELGHAADKSRQWTLTLSYAFIFYKYFHSSDFRGSGPGDTSGCRAPDSAALGGATASGGEPSVSASDRCGGPVNPDFSFQNGFVLALARGKWSLTTTLLIVNTFDYAVATDAYTSANAIYRGRNDTTWGIVAVGYQWRPRIGFSAGISSQQPALDARQQNLRFPFFDLSGGLNANNYTQLFASVNGTL